KTIIQEYPYSSHFTYRIKSRSWFHKYPGKDVPFRWISELNYFHDQHIIQISHLKTGSPSFPTTENQDEAHHASISCQHVHHIIPFLADWRRVLQQSTKQEHSTSTAEVPLLRSHEFEHNTHGRDG